MNTLLKLSPGDSVEIIAPASRCSDNRLSTLKNLLESWDLTCIINESIFGDDVLCANTDEIRFHSLKNALHNPETKAVICARGGYGSMRLIPAFSKLPSPSVPKLFLGMSDITALHLYISQQWQWPTILASLTSEQISTESIELVRAMLFGEIDHITFSGKALNAQANINTCISASLTGGNLCLLQTSIGTIWQMQGQNKIIFLEDVDERGYRVDRMLEHMRQAQLFQGAVAIVFGDFIGGDEPNGNNLTQSVIERFAQQCDVPVIQIEGVGHGYVNFPLMLGSSANLQLGKTITLTNYC